MTRPIHRCLQKPAAPFLRPGPALVSSLPSLAGSLPAIAYALRPSSPCTARDSGAAVPREIDGRSGDKLKQNNLLRSLPLHYALSYSLALSSRVLRSDKGKIDFGGALHDDKEDFGTVVADNGTCARV